jgi:hypothetical protein
LSDGRYAQIIGCSKYDDLKLNSLFKSARNLLELKSILASQEFGEFNVTAGLDLNSDLVKLEVRSFLAERKENNQVLLYFACNGIKDKNGSLYFAFKNTNLKDLENTAISLDFITDAINDAASNKQILILDCYFSGLSDKDVVAKPGMPAIKQYQFDKGGRVTIAASDEIQQSIIDGKLLTLFNNSFYFLDEKIIDGIKTGDADRDQDGKISLNELYDYAWTRINKENLKQRPQKWSFAEDYIIANNYRISKQIESSVTATYVINNRTSNPYAQTRLGEPFSDVPSTPSSNSNINLNTKTDLKEKKTVFISYSHEDRNMLERLRAHLNSLVRDESIEVWDDTRIKVGDKWREEIQESIDNAKIAILLISADFLASDFIYRNELPPLLESAKENGTKIFSVILSPCRFHDYPAINQYQAINDPQKPLTELPRVKKEKIWNKLCIEIKAYFEDSQ